MVLLFKKGQRENSESYRGISLINTIAKIFTTILNERILIWLEYNNIITECQSGFGRNRDCVDILFDLSAIVGIVLRV